MLSISHKTVLKAWFHFVSAKLFKTWQTEKITTSLVCLNLEVILKKFNSGKKEQYRIRLQEKQKLRFHYGLTERQLLRYVHIAGKAKRSTGQVLLQLLEMRLDNILFRLGMASTIPWARQLVNHRHILVNGRIVNIPSFRCKPRDIITTKENQISKGLVQNYIASSDPEKLRKHLTIDTLEYKGLVWLR
ncbi:hypothetical protein ZWY2020_021069 [Hordeum vulgare]|nr:hypothetical protein ZWY2020_021069 [Hordeum vulgare]